VNECLFSSSVGLPYSLLVIKLNLLTMSCPPRPSQSFTPESDHLSSPVGMETNITLWQFLLELLLNHQYKHIITWTNNDGEFKLVNAEEVARLWGLRKNKHNMNYDKLSRALRYYYDKNIIKKVLGQKFVYRFVAFPEIVKMENKIPFHVKMESIGSSGGSPGSGGSGSCNGQNVSSVPSSTHTASSAGALKSNLNLLSQQSLVNLQREYQQHLHSKYHLLPPSLHQSLSSLSSLTSLPSMSVSTSSPSPPLEPTDLSCKSSSSPRSQSSGQSSLNSNGKRFIETDNDSVCSDNEVDSDGGVSSGSSKRMKLSSDGRSISRSPSPVSNRSVTSSPASSGSDNNVPMNLVRVKENTSDGNNNNSNSANNNNNSGNAASSNSNGQKKTHRIKPKPPPITGIPTSPSRPFASSLQTPVVTLASPFTKNQTQSLLSATAAAAAMFPFWPSPFVVSPRYAGSPTTAGGSNFFQFPGHGSANGANLPRTPLGFSLSPLMSNAPYPFLDPALFSSSVPPSSKSIPVHQ